MSLAQSTIVANILLLVMLSHNFLKILWLIFSIISFCLGCVVKFVDLCIKLHSFSSCLGGILKVEKNFPMLLHDFEKPSFAVKRNANDESILGSECLVSVRLFFLLHPVLCLQKAPLMPLVLSEHFEECPKIDRFFDV